MKKLSELFIVYIILSLPLSVNAQNENIDTNAVIYKYTFNRKHGIQYRFPIDVSTLIDSIISQSSSQIWFGEISQEADTFGLYMYSLKKKPNIEDNIGKLYRQSGRFIETNGKRVPIYFSMDIYFGNIGFLFTGYDFYIEFYYNRFGGKSIIEYDVNR